MTGKISIKDTIEIQFKKLVRDMPEMGDFTLAAISSEAKKHIEENYLSGQVLNVDGNGKDPFYSKNKPGEWKVTGRLFNMFEKGKRVVSNLSGQSIDTGLIDKREVLKPASKDMQSRVDPILKKVLERQKERSKIIEI